MLSVLWLRKPSFFQSGYILPFVIALCFGRSGYILFLEEWLTERMRKLRAEENIVKTEKSGTGLSTSCALPQFLFCPILKKKRVAGDKGTFTGSHSSFAAEPESELNSR